MTTTTKTASEMKKAYSESRSVVRMHFTAKGNVAWQACLNMKDHGTVGTCRISKKDAAEYLAKFGLTTEQVIAVAKAEEVAKAELKEIALRENRRYNSIAAYHKALDMVFGTDEADTTTTDAEENTVDTEAELIKHNGLSFEGFLATNAGLTIEEYRARKVEQQAAEQAEAERREKIFNLKSEIAGTEYKITETSGTLNDIIKNHYNPANDDGSWDEYTAELGDTLATAVSTLNTLKAQLAELEPAIIEDNTDNTTEDNVDDTEDNTATKTDEPKEFTANCYYTYTKDDGEWNGSQSKNFASATEAATWIINLVRENGYTLTEPTNIRDWENHKKYYANEDDFNAANTTTDTAEVKDITATAKVDRLAELKASKLLIYKAINNALRGHYVKLESGEFYDASEAGFTTTGFDADRPEFEKLYFKDENGAYVEVSDKALDAFNRLESEHGIVCDAIKAEIARTAVKFEVGKWYTSDETYWDGNPCDNRYCVLKRTKKFVTIYDYQNDDWHYIDNYDPDDEIDGEFDCIFRKKIQFDERGEYVDWRDENGELVTLCAKDVTDKPVDEDSDNDDAEDDATEDNVEVEPATDKTPASAEIELPADDFTAKLAKLEAKRDAAQKIADQKQAALIKAQAEHETAVEAWRESNCAVGRLGELEAENLSAKLLPLNIAAVKVTKQDGYTDYVYAETLVIRYDEGKFIISGDCSIKKFCTLARYDTPEQVTRVINGLKAAAEHETKFKFPTVEELNQPSKEDLRGSLERAIKITKQKYREYKREGDKAGMRRESELFEICLKAIKELEAA